MPSTELWGTTTAIETPTTAAGPQAPVIDWLAARPVRVVLLLGAVWLLNGFDLLFTIQACRLGCFIELNPLAARVLGEENFAGIILYKLALVGAGTSILYLFRRHRISELSCWLLTVVYAGLAYRWQRYYEVFTHYYYHSEPTTVLRAWQ